MKSMKKFKVETPDAGGLDLIDEFNDELDAMRGADSEPEDGGLIGGLGDTSGLIGGGGDAGGLIGGGGDAGYVGGDQIGKVEAGSPFRVGVA
tara:strand:+ start:1443 stop:1718 length:276 start_codon:yes stop_codon:yes gene_type:complete